MKWENKAMKGHLRLWGTKGERVVEIMPVHNSHYKVHGLFYIDDYNGSYSCDHSNRWSVNELLNEFPGIKPWKRMLERVEEDFILRNI